MTDRPKVACKCNTAAQLHLENVRQKVAELEQRLNYKANPLSELEQDRLNTDLRNTIRMRKWTG